LEKGLIPWGEAKRGQGGARNIATELKRKNPHVGCPEKREWGIPQMRELVGSRLPKISGRKAHLRKSNSKLPGNTERTTVLHLGKVQP